MKVLLNLCLLFGLISPVVLLTCKMCKNHTGIECRVSNSETCKVSNPRCKNIIFNSNVFLNTPKTFKSCAPGSECHPGLYSLTTSGGGFLNVLLDCCKTNNCNSKPLKFPTKPMEPNGLECVGCHHSFKKQEKCEGNEVVKCLGDQTKCIDMKISYTSLGPQAVSGTFTTKGCATPQMCKEENVKSTMLRMGVIITNMTLKCCDFI